MSLKKAIFEPVLKRTPPMTKDDIRKEVRRRLLSPDVSREIPKSTIAAIFDSEEWNAAQRILLYCALPDEAATDALIAKALDEGKEVILPKVDGDMVRLFLYSPADGLHGGRFGIAEPAEGSEEITDYSSIRLAFIPGRAFTMAGDRLGRGRGYYDRLLPHLPCPKWGLALGEQIFDELPTDPWDIRLDKVVR